MKLIIIKKIENPIAYSFFDIKYTISKTRNIESKLIPIMGRVCLGFNLNNNVDDLNLIFNL